MMADPTRYRKVMYDLFFEGKQPELTPEEKERLAKRPSKGGRGSGGAPSRSEMDALEALRLRASQLRDDPQK